MDMSGGHLFVLVVVLPLFLLLSLDGVMGSASSCRVDRTDKGRSPDTILSRQQGVDAHQLNSSHVTGEDGVSTCTQQCCQSENCNVAVFLENFKQRNAQNCLLIKCAPIEKCVWERRPGFVSAVLHKNVHANVPTTTTRTTTTRTTTTKTTAPPTTTTPPDTETEKAAVVLTGEDKAGRIYAVTEEITSPSITSTPSTTPTPSTSPTPSTTVTITTSTAPDTSAASSAAPSIVSTSQPSLSSTTAPSTASTTQVMHNVTAASNGTASLHEGVTWSGHMNVTWYNSSHVQGFADLGGHVSITATTVALISALAVGVTFTIAVLVLAARRLYDGWQRRYYHRMDYLVDGMYN